MPNGTNDTTEPKAGGKKPGLNIHAKEFVCADLVHSKSSGNVAAVVGKSKSPSPPSKGKVHFCDDKENLKKGSPSSSQRPTVTPLTRSKSLGAADMRLSSSELPLAAIGSFPHDVQANITKAINGKIIVF